MEANGWADSPQGENLHGGTNDKGRQRQLPYNYHELLINLAYTSDRA
jgi:hypothetical protein